MKKYLEKTKILRVAEYKDLINNTLEVYKFSREDMYIKNKLLAMNMYANGSKQRVVCEAFKCSRKSLDNWFCNFTENGIDGLREFRGIHSGLTDSLKEKIREFILDDPQKYGYDEVIWSGYLVQKHLSRNFNIEKSYGTVLKWMHKSGLVLSRPKKSLIGSTKQKQKSLKIN